MDFAYSNGSQALALTDHGNCNGLSYQVLHAKKMKKEGKDFKPIYGCEMYFNPSISQWRKDKEEIQKTTKARKEDEEISGATVENEEETKKTKRVFSIGDPILFSWSKIRNRNFVQQSLACYNIRPGANVWHALRGKRKGVAERVQRCAMGGTGAAGLASVVLDNLPKRAGETGLSMAFPFLINKGHRIHPINTQSYRMFAQ